MNKQDRDCIETMHNYMLSDNNYLHGDRAEINYICSRLEKLGQLENIEEELGIDLVTLIKALKEPVYVVINNKIVETYCGYIGEECKTISFDIDGKDYKNLYDIETFYVLTKEYGKTWALTKGELEK